MYKISSSIVFCIQLVLGAVFTDAQGGEIRTVNKSSEDYEGRIFRSQLQDDGAIEVLITNDTAYLIWIDAGSREVHRAALSIMPTHVSILREGSCIVLASLKRNGFNGSHDLQVFQNRAGTISVDAVEHFGTSETGIFYAAMFNSADSIGVDIFDCSGQRIVDDLFTYEWHMSLEPEVQFSFSLEGDLLFTEPPSPDISMSTAMSLRYLSADSPIITVNFAPLYITGAAIKNEHELFLLVNQRIYGRNRFVYWKPIEDPTLYDTLDLVECGNYLLATQGGVENATIHAIQDLTPVPFLSNGKINSEVSVKEGLEIDHEVLRRISDWKLSPETVCDGVVLGSDSAGLRIEIDFKLKRVVKVQNVH